VIADEFAFARFKERLEQFSSAVARRRVVDGGRVDAGTLCEVLNCSDELFSEGDGAAVEVGGPERRFAAVDEEAAGRWSVGDDALGADAEAGVGELFVGRHPAARVAPPAELGERLVEPLRERGQHRLGVELRGP
jgi:hypothetical protein